MPRPQRRRRICGEPKFTCFNTEKQNPDEVFLTLDEYETIRLVDFEKLTHGECAAQMEISRTTVTEIHESARYKIADCIVNGKRIRIEGGKYRICDGTTPCPHFNRCKTISSQSPNTAKAQGEKNMKIAVTYENGQIFQHFGHTEQFKIYTIKDGQLISSEIVNTNGSGHGALSCFLTDMGVDTLICGGIGGGAINALTEAGIKLFGGVSGAADEAVSSLINGTLMYNPDVHCSHHESGAAHTCGEHSCGEHSCH